MPEDTIIEDTAGACKGEIPEQEAWKDAPARSSKIKGTIMSHVKEIFRFIERPGDKRSFHEVEKALIPMVFALGRLFISYYLARRHERSQGVVRRFLKKGFRRRNPQRRTIATFFGGIIYWRTYVRRKDGGGGVYPLDASLGLTKDGFSMHVISLMGRLATLMSFDQGVGLLFTFMTWAPSKTTVEKAVLGLGRFTAAWFRDAPAAKGDGEVLVLQFDSKATPTATESELEKRRGTRRANPFPESRRHRNRELRHRRGPKRRRKKGDKSKNGKAATIVVMYTLKMALDDKGRPALLGPINVWRYASYAPKRHAFAIARREADKRGFTQGSGKKVQIVVDGDNDLEAYAGEFFPEADLTLDIAHALEKLWIAGECLFKEGTRELEKWMGSMKNILYSGKAETLVAKLRQALEDIPKTGPGNKGKRKRLSEVISYLEHRIPMMDYKRLMAQDLEIASGMVEGSVKHVIAKRFDNGSMRWIKERAEPLLQLRCIDINGDWDAFISFVETRLGERTEAQLELQTLLQTKPAPLPTLGVNK